MVGGGSVAGSSSFDFGDWMTTGWWRPASSPSTGPSLKFMCEQRPPHFPCQSPPERHVAPVTPPLGPHLHPGRHDMHRWESVGDPPSPASSSLWLLVRLLGGLQELKFMLTWDSFYLSWRTGPRGSSGEECLPNLISCPQYLSLPLYVLVQEGSLVLVCFQVSSLARILKDYVVVIVFTRAGLLCRGGVPAEFFLCFFFVCCCCWVAQSYLTLCDPMDCSTPGFPVLHHLPDLAQTHVHWVDDAIQPSHPLSPPSSPALPLSQHQGLFQCIGSLN